MNGFVMRSSAAVVVVVGAPVLILDDELRAIIALGDDGDPSAAGRLDFGRSNRGEIDADRVADGVELLGQ